MGRIDLRRRATGSAAARVGVAAVAMLIAAEVAVYAIGSASDPIAPVPVVASDFFESEAIERARSYRSGQLWLMLAGLTLQVGLLLALALGRPRAARRALARLGARPLAGAAGAGAGIAVVLALVALPPRVAAHERAVDVGLSTQTIGPWLWDLSRATAISALLAAAGALLLVALLRRWPRRWWIPGAAAVTAIAIVTTWVAPVVVGPIFNRFEPLPERGALRAEVLELAERADVDVGEVYSVDASRRSTRESAYVGGIGSTKRVVLYDNLLANAPPDEVRAVVAHELAHVANDDIRRGITFVAVVAPFGLLFARELGGALARRAGAEPGTVPALPAFVLAILIASTAIGIVSNQLSRQMEADADSFALELTDDPAAMVGLQRRLSEANVSDPDPAAAVRFLFRTHPTTVERIGIARAYEQREAPATAD